MSELNIGDVVGVVVVVVVVVVVLVISVIILRMMFVLWVYIRSWFSHCWSP